MRRSADFKKFTKYVISAIITALDFKQMTREVGDLEAAAAVLVVEGYGEG